jgi:hypothetical protein
MSSEDVAIMSVLITLILTSGAVLIFRPVAKRLAELLHAMTEQRLRQPAVQPEMAQIKELLTGIDGRLGMLEERQDFAEALLASGERREMRASLPH